MHTKGPKEDPLVDLGYETRDINYDSLRNVAIVFTFFALFCFGIVAIWFGLYGPKMDSKLDPRKPLPTPLIQSNIAVRTDIQEFRQKETAQLSSSGRNQDGSYHIPIEAAMDLIAKRGLPHVQTSVPAQSPGNTIPQNALPPGQHALPANPLISDGTAPSLTPRGGL